MIQLLTRTGIVGIIILFILNIVLKLKYLLLPLRKEAFWNSEQNWLIKFSSARTIFIQYPEVWGWISVIVIFIFGLIINHILRTEKFVNRDNYTPLLSVILVTSLHPVFILFSDYLLITGLIIWSLQKAISLFKTEKLRIQLLNIGILIGFCTDIKIGVYLFLLIMISNLMFIRRLNLFDFIALVIGFVIPIYFGYSYHYLFNNDTFKHVTHVSIQFPQYAIGINNLLFALLVFLIMLIYSNYVAYKVALNKKIQFQKMWNVFNITTLGLLVMSLISSSLPSAAFIMPYIIGNFVIYMCFNNSFKPAWNNFALILTILAVILNQYFIQ